MESAGRKFRKALDEERPLQIAGAVHAYAALLARRAGFRAIYVSGAGVANASHGLPDLGMTNLGDVLEDVRRITSAVDSPVLVDVDAGFGGAFSIARTVKEMIRAGAAAIHVEDQVAMKRCGHRPGKELVGAEEMCDRIRAAVDARTDDDFAIMARTDAHAVEGFAAAVDRAGRYVDAGADLIFAEALSDLDEFRRFTAAVSAPVLANMTEFGRTPLLTVEELRSAGVRMALYPLSAFRAMNAAAWNAYRTIREEGTQRSCVESMQTRAELYDVLNYYDYERKLDELFAQSGKERGADGGR